MIIKSNSANIYHAFYCTGCQDFHKIDDRWDFDRNYESPTISPSILVRGRYVCHSFIRNGKIEYLSDCTHALAGTTVKLEHFPHPFYFSDEGPDEEAEE